MKIRYRSLDEYIPVDVDQLRPGTSYDKLIASRSAPIDSLIERFGSIPQEFLNLRCCPHCGSDRFGRELHKDHLDLVRCLECNLVYVNPVFNEDHYRNVYSSESYMQIVRDLGETSHEYRVDRFGKERIKILAPHLGGLCSVPPRLLDVGCSTGFFVEAATKEGWDAYGIDLNPSAVSFGRSRGLNLSVGDLDQSEFEPASFDVVTMFDVIEHVIDPSDLITQAMRLLRPGGLIFLYVPNYDSASRILLKEKAHFIWPTHHLTYFTPKTLEAFITSLGLSPLYLEAEGMDIEDYIWHLSAQEEVDTDCLRTISDELQFFINAGGYGKNLRILARYN